MFIQSFGTLSNNHYLCNIITKVCGTKQTAIFLFTNNNFEEQF